jgi:methylmalonyl-CoA mutase cobalamin-binding subunit
MPPTVRHELGALAFGTAARRAGLPVLYLGPDLPVDEWVATARRTHARAAVIGVLTGGDVRPAVEVATALRAAEPGLAILFGGRSATKAGAAFAARSAAAAEAGDAAADSGPLGDPPLVLPEPLVAAVRALEDAISDTASTPTA